MTDLPDDIWRRILEIGVSASILRCRDLCCFAISCRRFNQLSLLDSLWSLLLFSDFPATDVYSELNKPSATFKSNYKIRFERERRTRLMAHQREVLRIYSWIVDYPRRLQKLQRQSREESRKFESASAEIKNLQKFRQSSVNLTAMQPEVIRSWHRQLVEHSVVSIESRINCLEMELKLCTHQIALFDTSMKMEKIRVAGAKRQLDSMMYHPVKRRRMENFGMGDFEQKQMRGSVLILNT